MQTKTAVAKRQFNVRHTLNIAYFPLVFLTLELALNWACFQYLAALPYIILSSLGFGLLLTGLLNFLPHRIEVIATGILTLALVIFYGGELVYYKVFGTFFSLSSLTMTGAISQFYDIIAKVMRENIGWILLMIFVPMALLIAFSCCSRQLLSKFSVYSLFAGILILVLLLVDLHVGVLTSDQNQKRYTNDFMPNVIVQYFGLSMMLPADAEQLLGFGGSDSLSVVVPPTVDSTDTSQDTDSEIDREEVTDTLDEVIEEVIVYEDQVLEIDFDALIAGETDETVISLHEYFSTATAQTTNEYTGMFEGQNLIFITAESFSHYVIDEELTPTLYKLYSEGFQFTDFYTPGWSVSTTDGEYVAMTGLIPKSGVRSFTVASENSLPFTMGQQTTLNGYSPIVAYHNHTYDYYSRDLSHPNMGYDYKALGMGLDVTPTWPESDLEMIQLSVADYINSDELFHAYYMTVSGHQLYTYEGNSMASKNREYVEDLDYSDSVKAYLAANLELEFALEYLMEELEAAGKAENTVIVLSADHYPYGLTNEELEEMNGEAVDSTFGVYQNALLIWSGSMEEPIVVDQPASSLDIIPTLSNLMGFSYDSRMLMGSDILGDDYQPLVIFSDRSFIIDTGRYNSSTQVFTPDDPDYVISDEELDYWIALVDQKFELSKLILETDYYQYIEEYIPTD